MDGVTLMADGTASARALPGSLGAVAPPPSVSSTGSGSVSLFFCSKA